MPPVADTVGAMLIVLALLAGAVLALGTRLGPAAGSLSDGLFTTQADTAHGLAAHLIGAFAGKGHAAGVELAAAVLGVMAPGLVCLFLVEVCLGSKSVRRQGGVLLVAAAIASFFFVSWTHAVPLLAVAVLVAVLLWSPVGALLAAGIAVLTGFLAARLVTVVLGGNLRSVDAVTTALKPWGQLPDPYGTLLVGALALVPIAAAAGRLVRRG